MKKIMILIVSIVFLQASIVLVKAQFRTDSNTVTTRIGSAPSGEFFCPIPNGTVTCGSKNVPVNGCGHCGVGYEKYMSNCTYEGIYYAMDIAGSYGENIILPSVDGKNIQWAFVTQSNNVGNQAIQQFSGTDLISGDKFWLQLHHTEPGSGNPGTHSSGEIGAQICNNCNKGPGEGPHVHVEFAKIDTSGKTIWQDAPSYFCK